MQRAAVHLEVELVSPRLRDVQPAFVADRRVLLDRAQAGQVEIVHLAALLRLHLFTLQTFPDPAAVKRVSKVSRNPRVLKQEVGDPLEVLSLQAQVGHAAGGPAGMRLAEESDQALEAVFLIQGTQRNRVLGLQLKALGIARRMTSRAAPRVKQGLPLLRRHRIRCLQGEVAFLDRCQEVRDRSRHFIPFLLAELREDIGHRGSGFGPVRGANEGFQVSRIHPRADPGQAWRFLRARAQRRVPRMAGHAIQLLDQHLALELRPELARGQARKQRLREGGNQKAGSQGESKGNRGEKF